MPEWLIALVVAVVGASGVWLGNILSNRTASKALTQNGENNLIDQLQEELRTYREDAGHRATIQEGRLTALENNSNGYREHIYELRSHIWDGKPPPPPEWPAGLPR